MPIPGTTGSFAAGYPPTEPVALAVERDRARWQIVALLGGYGFGVAANATGEPISWVVLTLVAGVIFRGSLAGAWSGCFLAALTYIWVESLRAKPPFGEWGDLTGIGSMIGLAAVAIVIPLGLGTYQLAGRATGRRRGTPGHIGRILAMAAAVGGIVAIAALSWTWVTLTAVPASQAFELRLSAGWTSVPVPAREQDPAFGRTMTAVFGSEERPIAGEAVEHPVLGLSINGFAGTPEACLSSLRGWPAASSPLYDAPIVGSGRVDLPSGQAYQIERAPEPSGSRVLATAWTRTRPAILVDEPLCYVLVITTPPESPVSEADASAIIDSFRFR